MTTLAQIAAQIDTHLKRFERDPKINKVDKKKRSGLHPFYYAGAWAGGRWVYVKYIDFQGSSNLSRAEALAYLAWLDAGNVGQHYEMKN